MIVAVCRIPYSVKAIPEWMKFIKHREVHFVDSLYQNNCNFETLSILFMFDNKFKCYRPLDGVAEGIWLKIWRYSLSGKSTKSKDVQEFVYNYKGFDLAAEDKKNA